MLMRLPQGFEWLVIAGIVLLLFGAKRMPDAARGLGRSLRIFKAETKGLIDDDDVEFAPTPVVNPMPADPVAVTSVEPAVVAPRDVPGPDQPEG
jgi:sec-independent protein translocase protein TatA